MVLFVFFFKQKTAYEMRISDWSSDVCSSDLTVPAWDNRRLTGGHHDSLALGPAGARVLLCRSQFRAPADAAVPNGGAVAGAGVEPAVRRVDRPDAGRPGAVRGRCRAGRLARRPLERARHDGPLLSFGSASCRDRVCKYG